MHDAMQTTGISGFKKERTQISLECWK